MTAKLGVHVLINASSFDHGQGLFAEGLNGKQFF